MRKIFIVTNQEKLPNNFENRIQVRCVHSANFLIVFLMFFLLLGYLIVKSQKDVLLKLQRKQTGRIVDYINHFEVSMEVIGAHVFPSR